MLIWSEGSLCPWVKDPENVEGLSVDLSSLTILSLAIAGAAREEGNDQYSDHIFPHARSSRDFSARGFLS